jgi:hypothetical protein
MFRHRRWSRRRHHHHLLHLLHRLNFLLWLTSFLLLMVLLADHAHGYGSDHGQFLELIILLTISSLLIFILIFICFYKSWLVLHSFHLWISSLNRIDPLAVSSPSSLLGFLGLATKSNCRSYLVKRRFLRLTKWCKLVAWPPEYRHRRFLTYACIRIR